MTAVDSRLVEFLGLLLAVHLVVVAVWLYDRPYNAARAIVDNHARNREAHHPVSQEF